MSETKTPDQAVPVVVGQRGFFGDIVQSVFEPGVNPAVVMAMNVSFLLLILVLFALAFLTSWNYHVLLLLGCTSILWITMIWFVVELTKVQNRSDNMPPSADGLNTNGIANTEERKKDR